MERGLEKEKLYCERKRERSVGGEVLDLIGCMLSHIPVLCVFSCDICSVV
jgi:hypothetical protein